MEVVKVYITMKELEEYIAKKISPFEGSKERKVIFRDVEKNYNDFSIEFLCEVIDNFDGEIGWLSDGKGRTHINLDELEGE